MRIALFGATGFVGSYIIESLIKNNYSPSVLLRDKSKEKLIFSEKNKVTFGDINNLNAIEKTIKDSDAIIYNIGLIREFPKQEITFQNLHFEGAKRCIDIAESLGVNRFILMSANGVNKNGTNYQITKFKAEEYLKKSKLDYTIFRPSLIFGKPKINEQIEFCTQLRNDMLSLPIPVPLFYKGFFPFKAGTFKLSPIHVKNVADFFVNSIKMDETIGKTYTLGGKKSQTWKEIIQKITISSNKDKWKMPTPIFMVRIVVSLLDSFKWFPITKDQLNMLIEGNTTHEDYFNEFKIEPINFEVDNLSYLLENSNNSR